MVADAGIATGGRVSIGGGAHGVAVHLDGAALLGYLDADVVDITA